MRGGRATADRRHRAPAKPKVRGGASFCCDLRLVHHFLECLIRMKSIQAIWINGQIIPTQPVDWPEGTALAVEPIESAASPEDMTDLLADDPDSIRRWLVWLDSNRL
jgi:hypothetical protein